jgi:hypothetical protein
VALAVAGGYPLSFHTPAGVTRATFSAIVAQVEDQATKVFLLAQNLAELLARVFLEARDAHVVDLWRERLVAHALHLDDLARQLERESVGLEEVERGLAVEGRLLLQNTESIRERPFEFADPFRDRADDRRLALPLGSFAGTSDAGGIAT